MVSKEGRLRASFSLSSGQKPRPKAKTGARQKRAAETGTCDGPSLGVIDPLLLSRFESEKSFSKRILGNQDQVTEAPSSFWAASCSCSTSPLSRLKNGEKLRREGLARGSAEDAADGMALFSSDSSENGTPTAGTLAGGSKRESQSIERGTAAPVVLVRQIRVAELDETLRPFRNEATREERNAISEFETKVFER